MEHKFKGQHFIVDVYVNDLKNLIYTKELENIIAEQLLEWKTVPLKSCHKIFSTGGFSLNILISESHFSIHTYPEKKALFIDFFTCSDYKVPQDEFIFFIKKIFNVKEYKFYYLDRGTN